ncbi:MAG: Stp1/IreP family PP2C-type Ser/Thr phosphatase [Clostridia bacterium]|nr:Stp1/IreP family PP2C-type Ser/Thr phosphatase [Clostridia bacterium]
MLGYGKTDIGQQRPKNEDSLYVSNEPIGKLHNLYIVADGMGGHKAGQVASNTAIEAFLAYLNKYQPDSTEEPLDMLIGGINMANEAVYKLGHTYDEYGDMGTTMVAATVVDSSMYIAHVGDSRLYRISGGEITQITNDHSLVAEMVKAGQISEEEARVHPQRNCITRAVGTDSTVTADGLIVKVKEGDIIVMCSDGLNTMIEDDEICSIAKAKVFTLEERADMLINAANSNGGLDNISAVIIDI